MDAEPKDLEERKYTLDRKRFWREWIVGLGGPIIGLAGPIAVAAGVYYGFQAQLESNKEQAKLHNERIVADQGLERTRLSKDYWSEVLKICMEATELGGRIAASTRTPGDGGRDADDAIRRFRALLLGRSGILETFDRSAPEQWPFRRALRNFSSRLDDCERSPQPKCADVLEYCTQGIAFQCSKYLCQLLPEGEQKERVRACSSAVEPECPPVEGPSVQADAGAEK